MYILKCSDGTYYKSSMKDLQLRLEQHQSVAGMKYTARRLPVRLLYFQEFQQIDGAFYKEKQVQGWNME